MKINTNVDIDVNQLFEDVCYTSSHKEVLKIILEMDRIMMDADFTAKLIKKLCVSLRQDIDDDILAKDFISYVKWSKVK